MSAVNLQIHMARSGFLEATTLRKAAMAQYVIGHRELLLGFSFLLTVLVKTEMDLSHLLFSRILIAPIWQ